MPFDWPLARLCLRGAWGGHGSHIPVVRNGASGPFEGTLPVFANGFRFIFADRRGHCLMDLIGVFECVCRSSLMAPIVFSSMDIIGSSVKVSIGSFWRPASAFFKGRISYYELPLGSLSVLVVGPQRPFCWLV
jgi:hypothetical protein